MTRLNGTQPRPENQPFADALRAAMLKNKLRASEVARRVWGTTKDNRGYDVARNRDRIGHYLSGTSYPEPKNLVKLADAVGLTVEDLAIERPDPPVNPMRGRATKSLRAEDVQISVQITFPEGHALFEKAVQRDVAQKIVALLMDKVTE